MSAYGPTPPRNSPILPSRQFSLPTGTLSVHHLTSATTPPSLSAFLYSQFQAELDRGTTYPQEYPLTRTAFDAYFLANDLFIGILVQTLSIDDAIDWSACLGGVYYVKPNYPGRSSHICNAGFLVMPPFRSMGIATALAKSYLDYAPRLGYKASIFNLVYVNNLASVRIWDSLGFQKIARIPRAGRLKRSHEHGAGEEYVDAWVIYKGFE